MIQVYALAVTYGSGGDKIHVYDLQFKATTLRQGSSSLEEIWSRLGERWISINQKQTNPMKYPEDMEIHDKFIQDQRVCQFLYAIDSKYETTKKEILKMDPLPSVDYTYNLFSRRRRDSEYYSRQTTAEQSPRMESEPASPSEGGKTIPAARGAAVAADTVVVAVATMAEIGEVMKRQNSMKLPRGSKYPPFVPTKKKSIQGKDASPSRVFD